MRDPNRIHDICLRLEKCWSVVPDWRFTQLLCNALGDFIPFYMEDENTISHIERLLHLDNNNKEDKNNDCNE